MDARCVFRKTDGFADRFLRGEIGSGTGEICPIVYRKFEKPFCEQKRTGDPQSGFRQRALESEGFRRAGRNSALPRSDC